LPASGSPRRKPRADHRLRLLLHTLEFASGGDAGETRSGAIIHWLARRGHAVSVVAASGGGGGKGAKDGAMRVRRRPLLPAASPGTLAQRIRHVSFAVTSAPALIAETSAFRPDLVGALAASAAAASAVLAAARLTGVRAWLHLEADAPPLGIEPAFACVSIAAFDAERRLAARGVAPASGLALPAWVDTDEAGGDDESNLVRAALGCAGDDILALYVGSLAESGVRTALIEAARSVPPHGAVRFVVAGVAAELGALAKAAGTLPRLTLLRLPEGRDLGVLLAAADIHLMPEGAACDDRLVAAKLAALLASGRPVIARAPLPPLAPGIAAAMAAAPLEGEAFAAAVVRLAARSEERRARGLAARRAADDYFAKERVLRVLERRLIALAASREAAPISLA
jgi:putative colanic acid biosynthesis glycosyltransferase WcaI